MTQAVDRPPSAPAADPNAFLRDAAEEAARILQADGAMVYLLQPSGRELRFAVDAGIRDSEARELIRDLTLPVGTGMFGAAVEHRAPIVTGDYPNDGRFRHYEVADRIATVAGMRSMAVAPLIVGDEVLGALGAFTSRLDDFDEARVRLLQALADHAAVRIANLRLIEELAQRVEAQRTLGSIAARITAIRGTQELLQEVVDAARRLLGSDGAHLTELPRGERERIPIVMAGHTDAETRAWLASRRFPLHGGINGLAAGNGELVWTADYDADPRIPHDPDDDDAARRLGLCGMAAAPLRAPGGEIIGTLAISFEQPHEFVDAELELLQRLADQAAIAIANARLRDELTESERRYRFLVDNSVDIMYTTDAEGRFTYLSERIEQLAGFKPEELIGRHFLDATDPAEGAALAAAWERLKAHPDERLRVRFHLPTKDGRRIAAEVQGLGIVDEEGRFVGSRGAARDMREIERLEVELRERAEQLARRVEVQRTLAEIAAQISSLRDPAAVLQRTVDEATRLLGADGGRIDLIDPDRRTLNWAYGSSPIDRRIVEGEVPADEDEGLDEGVAGRAVIERRPVITGDYLADTRFHHVSWADRYIREHGIASVMSAPLIGEQGAIGALTVHSRRPDFFDDDAAQLLGALASHAAVAVANARLYERLRQRVDAQRSLAGIAAQITSLRDPRAVIQRTVDEALRLLHAETVVMNALSADGEELGQPIAFAPADREVDDIPTPVGIGISGRAIAERRVVRTGDYVGDESFRHTPELDAFARERGLRSIMAAPLVGGEGPLGVLTVRSTRPHAFTNVDADLLGALASHAAVAITNARLYEQLEGRVEAQRTLAEIAAQLTSLTDPRAVLQRTVEETVRLLHADAALINPLSESGEHLELALAHAPATDELDDVVVPVGGGISGRAISQRAVVRTGDYLADPRFEHSPELDEYIARRRMRSVMTAPLLAPERPLGTLTVQSSRHDAFDEADADLLGLLANQAAVAITNARLLEELQRQSGELERQIASQQRLLGINENLLSALNPTGVLETIADALKQVVRYDNLAIYLVDRDAKLLRPVLARDRHAREVMQHVLPLGQGITSWAVERGEPLLINDALSDPRAVQIPGTPDDPEAIIIVPLMAKGDVLGAMNIGRIGREEVYFSQHDFELVQLFAGQAAIAVTNARLYEDLQRSEARYRFLVDNSPDIVWSVDGEGRFTFFSDSLEQRTGWKPEEMVGRHFSEFTAPESLPIAEAAWQRMQKDPQHEERIRIELPLKDGRHAPVEIAMTSTVADGRFDGAHGAVRDVSERERLETDLRRQAAQLAASAERATLARELHDSVTQALFSMGLTMRSLELLLAQGEDDAARAKLGELRELQKDALAEMRTLIFELRPASLETDGLEQALRTHATAVGSRTGLAVTVETELGERLPLEVEEALYRIAQEALHNVVKHAAASRTHIRLLREGNRVRLAVSDDGRGFDPAHAGRGRLGLVGMEQRAERIGGRLEVTSRPGDGATVEVLLPVSRAGDDGQDGPDSAGGVDEAAAGEHSPAATSTGAAEA
jgi:two-component system sensor histidine kinase UhpB